MKQKLSQSPGGKKLLDTLLDRPRSNLAYFDHFYQSVMLEKNSFAPKAKERQKREEELSPVCSLFVAIIHISKIMYC